MWIRIYENYVDTKDIEKLKNYVRFVQYSRSQFRPNKIRLLLVTIAPAIPQEGVWTNGLDERLIRFFYNTKGESRGRSRLRSRLYSILCYVQENTRQKFFVNINCTLHRNRYRLSDSENFLSSLKEDGIFVLDTVDLPVPTDVVKEIAKEPELLDYLSRNIVELNPQSVVVLWKDMPEVTRDIIRKSAPKANVVFSRFPRGEYCPIINDIIKALSQND